MLKLSIEPFYILLSKLEGVARLPIEKLNIHGILYPYGFNVCE
jgi:hypothetical protein